jgi:hypothetical protein
LNESADATQDGFSKALTNRAAPVGVPQEYLQFSPGRYLTIADARLVSIAMRWPDLPDAVRGQVEALCANSS